MTTRRKLIMVAWMTVAGLALLGMSFVLSGCSKTVPVATPGAPTTLSPTVAVLDTLEIACEAAQPVVSPTVAAWLSTCPTVVSTGIAVVGAGSAPAKVADVIVGLKAFLASAPVMSTLSPNDQKYASAILAAVNGALTIYAQVNPTASLHTQYASAFFGPSKPVLSAADKAKLKELKARAATLRKKLAKAKK